ncbi:MAG: ABC transporter permease [Armatimonadetes bacterium]|nr:ABC transporter permease [Armatimonadota bacterium]
MEIWLGDYGTPQLIREVRAQMGLDRPIWEQYARFVSQISSGQLGRSLRTNRPVLGELRLQYPYTIQLTAASVVISSSLGLAVGILAAIRHNSMFDLLAMATAMFWISVPAFWLGLILLIFFAATLGWFPIAGAGNPAQPLSLAYYLVLPALTLGARGTAVVARMTRSAMIDVLSEDYVRTARAKGLAERLVMWRHALRNALAPILSIIGIELVALMGGAVVIETVFSRPGVGRLLVNAVSARDYPMVQGTIFFFAAAVIAINFLTDLAYALVDPRIRYA